MRITAGTSVNSTSIPTPVAAVVGTILFFMAFPVGAQNEIYNSAVAGDPVLITTGRYVFDEDDIVFADHGFSVKRKYISEGTITGSIGGVWMLSLDSRIIRGTTQINYSVIEGMTERLNKMPSGETQLNSDSESVRKIGEEIRALYLQAVAGRDELLAMYNRAAALDEKNKKALFKGSPTYYNEVGNDNITLIDKDGTPGVFMFQSESGRWLKDGTVLESIDGKDALETGGFALKDGTMTMYYDADGLLIKIKESSGKTITISRDKSGKAIEIIDAHNNHWKIKYSGTFISRISGPEDQEVQYAYKGGLLSAVTDTEGDTVLYGYEDARLTRITKPDKSYRVITYGKEEEDGVRKVQSTTDEEGYIERFEYYPEEMMGMFVNKSGIYTKYFYDTSHRTIKTEYADGSIETFATGGNTVSTDNGISYTGRLTESGGAAAVREAPEKPVVELAFDERGYPSAKKTVISGKTYTEYWKYDAIGRVLEYINASGLKWTYSYSKKITVMTTPFGLERTYTYNNRKDLISIKERDIVTGENREKKMEYDKRHLLTCITDGSGNKTEYRYRGDESLVEKRQGFWMREYGYDVLGKPQTVTYTKAGESGSTRSEKISIVENPKSDFVKEPSFPASGEYSMDTRVLVTVTENGQKVAYLLNAWLQFVEGAYEDGKRAKWKYDGAGRVISVIDTTGGETLITYNAIGQVESIIYTDGTIRQYKYDSRGEIDSVQDLSQSARGI